MSSSSNFAALRNAKLSCASMRQISFERYVYVPVEAVFSQSYNLIPSERLPNSVRIYREFISDPHSHRARLRCNAGGFAELMNGFFVRHRRPEPAGFRTRRTPIFAHVFVRTAHKALRIATAIDNRKFTSPGHKQRSDVRPS